MKVIEVVISPSGQVQLVTKGFAGGSCRQASQLIERALGASTGEQLTPEYYRSTLATAQSVPATNG